MRLTDKTVIDTTKLIIVEGDDDERFIQELLRELNILDTEIINVGGNNFREYLPEIGKISGFASINQLAIISDADDDAHSTFQRIVNSINRIDDYDLVPPTERNTFCPGSPSVGVFIITKKDSEEGMLEDLCLASVEDHESMKCVDDFSECINRLGIVLRNPSKSRCQTFLSAMIHSVPHIGIAAQRGYWDFNSEALDGLKSFLTTFRTN